MADFEKLLDDFSFHLANMAGIAHATNPATRQRIEAEMESSRKALLAHVAAIESELAKAREALAVSDAQVKGQGLLIDALRSQIATGKSALAPGGHDDHE